MNDALKYLNKKRIGAWMKKRIGILIFIFLMLTIWCGCKKEDDQNKVLPVGSYKVYYVSTSLSGITWERYDAKATKTDDLIDELIEVLSVEPNNYAYRHTVGENIIMKEYTLNEDKLTINFDSMYQNQTPIEEALTRAAIVKTLTQIEGIQYVEFLVNGAALKDANDKTISAMTAADFIDDNDVESSSAPIVIVLFFSNEDGTGLVEFDKKMLYDGTITMEQLILLNLIEGPDDIESAKGVRAVIPKDTVLNNVTTKEGVCYVDFSKEFLNSVEGVNEDVCIYAVVNSLVELNNVNKVQIMIDGNLVEKYRDSIELDSIFERNLDLVEGIK